MFISRNIFNSNEAKTPYLTQNNIAFLIELANYFSWKFLYIFLQDGSLYLYIISKHDFLKQFHLKMFYFDLISEHPMHR